MGDAKEEETTKKQQQHDYDWSAHYDEEGRLYYYNSKTEESAWEAPAEGFNPPEEEPPEKEEKRSTTQQQQQYDWSAHYDDEGRLYYYNEKTEESAWEAPAEGFNPPEEDPPVEKQQNDETMLESKESEADGGESSKDEKDNHAITDDSAEIDEQHQAEAAADGNVAAAEERHNDDDDNATKIKKYVWSAHYDDEGRLYYYNETTEESAWEAPTEGFNPPEEEEQQQHAANDDEAVALPEEKADTVSKEKEEHMVDNKAEKKKYDWSAHYDDEGRLYYFNEKTEESVWEAPAEGFNPPESADEDNQEKMSVTAVDTKTLDAAAAAAAWVAYHDEEGRVYYYNQESGETSWDKPENYVEEAKGDEVNTAKSPTATDAVDDKGEKRDYHQDDVEMEDATAVPKQQEIQEKEEEETAIDPAVKRLQEAEAALNKQDSVLEPSCMANVTTVVASTGGNPAKAIAALIENYHGQTAICGLLARWLIDLNAAKQESSSSSTSRADAAAQNAANWKNEGETTADKIREAAQTVINKIAKERFTKDAGDSILDLSKSEAAFLEEMMDSPRWRKLLIDLYATQKDSAVLLYCLGAISKRGHHREIAKRINIGEHFAVFNAMLLSELAVIGGQAVSAGADVAAATSLNELMVDLRRACSTTSYTYLYSTELLRRLTSMARANVAAVVESSNNDTADDGQDRFRRAIRKWQALSEDLESSMLDPSVSVSAAGSSAIFRKRRLDVALTISDLYQGQRRRRRRIESNGGGPEEAGGHGNGGNNNEGLENALLNLLRKHSFGIQLNDTVLDQLLPSGLDMDTRGVGDLLIRHTLAVRALLGHLYKPGPTRITTPSTKNKCARLVALASIAAEETAKKEEPYLQWERQHVSSAEEEAPDELALTRMILQGSQLCEQLETVISFLVTSGSDKPGLANTNPGQKLCSLALKCATVGLGVMMWARELTHGPEFATSASFATLSVSVLSLVRLVAMQHPFARADALQVALAFLRHSNSDISYQKVNAIKECSLRLLLFLLTKGDVVPVFSSITARLDQPGSSDLDNSLVRYFVAGVLEIVQPPVSPVFVRMFGGLMKTPTAVDAVRSTYFAEANQKRLAALLKSFKDVRLYDGSQLSDEDASLVSFLLSVYQIE